MIAHQRKGRTFAEYSADMMTQFMGSWTFIIVFILFSVAGLATGKGFDFHYFSVAGRAGGSSLGDWRRMLLLWLVVVGCWVVGRACLCGRC